MGDLITLAVETSLSPSNDHQCLSEPSSSYLERSENEEIQSYYCSNEGSEIESFNKKRDLIEGKPLLSTEDIMRVAAARLIQLSLGHTEDDPLMHMHPLSLSNACLTNEDTKNINLACILLDAAEKVSNQQFDHARILIQQCLRLSSSIGNPVERVVYYCSDALQERINRGIGETTSKRPREKNIPAQDAIEVMLTANHLQLTFLEKVPLTKLMQFVSIQAILDNVALAKRIHVIDLSMRHGPEWPVLMQALAERTTCPIEYLKISAVGKSKEAISLTGERLVSFAETLSLPFHFKAIIVEDIKDLKQDMFGVKEGEAVGVYASFVLSVMIARPDELEILMKVLQDLKPSIMAIADVEAKHNSQSFVSRFTETLFYHSALFDCLDSCLDRDDANRNETEAAFLSQGIKSIIATEGSERLVRHVGITMWRSFFLRFGFLETELNEWTQYQVNLLLEQFAHGSSCTLHKNGKSLMVGWKGTPIFFISAWKFPLNRCSF